MEAYDFTRGACLLHPNVWVGSKAEKLRMSTGFPFCPRKRASLPMLELLPPPALGERRHRGLARRLVAVHRSARYAAGGGGGGFGGLGGGGFGSLGGGMGRIPG